MCDGRLYGSAANRGRQRRASAAKRSPLHAGLGSRPDAFADVPRALALVQASQDNDVLGPGKVEDSVREAVQKHPANVPIDDGARERVLRDERDGKVKGCDEPRTEALLPQLVPRVDGLDIFRRKVAEDDGEGHFFF